MTQTLERVIELTTVECGCCGGAHAIPTSLYNKARTTGARWYCPWGHFIGYSTTENDRLKADLDRAKREAERLEAARDQLDAEVRTERWRHELTRRSLAAQKGNVTRLKKRIGAGVCPVCHRSFQALHNHMSCKHPGYADED